MSEMYKIRGNEISVIFQEPMTSLNPVFTVERQLSEPLRIHQGMSKAEAKKQAVDPAVGRQDPQPGASWPSSTRTSSPAACASAS